MPAERTIPATEMAVAVGMMCTVINSGGSLESAITDVAHNGPHHLSRLFSDIVRDDSLRLIGNMEEGLNSMILSKGTPMHFRRSIRMIISASESEDVSERLRITREAETIVSQGVKASGESYVESLNTPCMVIFGLGIMVPMILMSLLPMASIGGIFSIPMFDETTISMITLLLIPGVILAAMFIMIARNPLRRIRFQRTPVMMVLMIGVLSIAVLFVSNDPFISIVSGVFVVCVSFLILGTSELKKTASIRSGTEAMENAMFDLGSELISGRNFENALKSSVSAHDVEMALSLDSALYLSRGDTETAVRNVLGPYSKEVSEMYVKVHTASLNDLTESGKLATSLGHRIQDRVSMEHHIKVKMKGISDMMIGTAALFAPLIMGLSIVLLSPLSSISGMAVSGNMHAILSIYLVELSFLISMFTSYLDGSDHSFRFSILSIISIVVFMVFSNLSI